MQVDKVFARGVAMRLVFGPHWHNSFERMPDESLFAAGPRATGALRRVAPSR